MITLTYDSKDAVPASLSELATEKDGKFIVKVEPAEKLVEFRDNNIELSKKIEQYENKLKAYDKLKGDDAEDVDVDKLIEELTELRTIKQKVDDGKLAASDAIETELQKRTKNMEESYEKKLKEAKTQIENLSEQLTTATQTIRYNTLSSHIDTLIANEKLGLNPTAKKAIITEAKEVFKYDEDEGEFIARNAKGEKIWGSDGKTPMSFTEWAETELPKAAPYVFKQSKGEPDNFTGKGVSEKELKKMSADELWGLVGQS